jgi:hypothetical protein
LPTARQIGQPVLAGCPKFAVSGTAADDADQTECLKVAKCASNSSSVSSDVGEEVIVGNYEVAVFLAPMTEVLDLNAVQC